MDRNVILTPNRGTYAALGPSISNPGAQTGVALCIPVVAPVNQILNPTTNVVHKVRSLSQHKALFGDSADDAFTSSKVGEVILGLYGVGPIYEWNVLDPEKHKGEPGTEKVAFFKGKAVLKNDKAIVGSIDIEDRTIGVDVIPSVENQKIVLTLADEVPAGGTQETVTLEKSQKNLEKAGVSLVDNVLTFTGTETVPDALYHGEKAYYPVVFPKPDGAVSLDVVVKNNLGGAPLVHDGIDLVNGNEEDDSVINGEYTLYLPFADKEGNRLKKADYTIDLTFYFADGTTKSSEVLIKRAAGRDISNATVTVSYETVDPTKVSVEDVIGTVTEYGVRTGIQLVSRIEPEFNVEPRYIYVPGFSHEKKVYDAIQALLPINGHWLSYIFTDIPLTNQSIREAGAWKDSKRFDTELGTALWPAVKNDKGGHDLAGLHAAALRLYLDASNGDIPFNTISNQDSHVAGQYFGEESLNGGYDQHEANALEKYGITTVCRNGGRWVFWGTRPMSFSDGASVDPRSNHDTQILMQIYLVNRFQRVHADKIDRPMDRSLVYEILTQEQTHLDHLVAIGALKGHPKAGLNEELNSTDELIVGNIYYQLEDAPAFPCIKIGALVSHNSDGYTDLAESIFGAE